jgi:hypothetical protein
LNEEKAMAERYDSTTDTVILEDGDAALLGAQPDEAGVEYADLNVDLSAEGAEKRVKAAAPAAPAAPAPKPAAEDDLPEAFKGKTAGQLAKMYQDAQALIGRQGQELGEVRRLADSVIKAQLAARAAAPAPKKDEPEENPDAAFFAKPGEAIQKAIENSPIVKQLREQLGQVEAEKQVSRMTSAKTRFDTDHPDAGEIMDSGEFREWVKASPIRVALLQRADVKYDYVAGNEVFSTWKALKGAKAAQAPAADAEQQAASAAAATLAKRKQQLKAAGVPSGGNAGGAAESGGGKIYRRSDILKLMEEKPEEYQRLAPEIERAYREKRVR